MKAYLIEPRDPLIVRDGRSFDITPGVRARTRSFPLPSTLAGALRTREGTVNGRFTADPTQLLQREIRGPLLVDISALEKPFAPAPLDALMLDGTRLFHLVPKLSPGDVTDLQYKWDQDTRTYQSIPEPLAPVQFANTSPQATKGKPRGMPTYWYWDRFVDWLKTPQDLDTTPQELGIDGPTVQYRVHVAIEEGKGKEGALFQTSGLEFTLLPSREKLSEARRLGLLVFSDAQNQTSRLGPLGGERRMMYWSESTARLPELQKPAEMLTRVAENHYACRVILLTPAYFAQGFRPTWLLQPNLGVIPTLRAAATGRTVVFSGWDYAKGKPKPSRRLAPAGSVYFLELKGPQANVESWVSNIWMHNISDDDGDDDQSRKEGLGLAVVGKWIGEMG